MTVDEQELLETEMTPEAAAPAYATGGEVSAMTLIEDVRAIRQRLDGVEVALRGLSVRLEEITPSTGSPGSGGNPAEPVGSLDELRKALLGDLQTDLRKNAQRSSILMGLMLLVTMGGLGYLGWMLRQLE